MNDNPRAAAILTLAMLVFAVEDALIKALTRDMPFSQVLGVIALGGAVVFGLVLRAKGERLWSRALFHPAIMLRNVMEGVASVAIVLALGLTELSTTAAITQATPLFITLGAAVWLREGVGWRRAAAIGLGFAGVLIVLRPGLAGFQPASLWAVLAACGFAIRDLATRRIPAGMSSAQVSASAFVALLLASVVMALLLRERPIVPNANQAWLMLFCVVCTIFGYGLLVTATRIGEASAVAPFRYARLVFALILAVAVFGERLDFFTVAGSAVIVGSGLYTFWREARLARRVVSPPNQTPSNASGPKAA